jgi:hypothetical protein
MLFRDHPLMRYRGVPSWPPDWIWTDGLEDKHPRGEVGILLLSNIHPRYRCFLSIDHEGSTYVGCLLIDDDSFCKYISALLQSCCNRSIAEIGNMDLSHTLYDCIGDMVLTIRVATGSPLRT